MAKTKNKGGRPTIYTKELSIRVCELLSQGKSMRTVCKEEWCPDGATLFRWLREYPEFREQYEKAKQEATDALAEEIIDIADDSSKDYGERGTLKPENVQRSRLRVDTRKWIMAKMKPKKYGEKIDVTSDGEKLPTPILNYVPNNNSNNEDTPAQ